MSVKQIKYNDSSFTLRFEFPDDWAAASITGVSIAITDAGGTSLLASTAATLYTSVALASASARGDATVTLGGTPGALSRGDRLLIAASAAGRDEIVEVDSYNSSTKVVSLRHTIQYAHSSTTSLYPCWCTYALDTSTTATWAAGSECTVLWTPDTDDHPVTELYVIGKTDFGSSETIDRFRVQYPSMYQARDRSGIEDIEREARERVWMHCKARNFDLNRLTDQTLMVPSVVEMMANLIASGGGDAAEYEQASTWERFTREFELFSSLTVWTDDNQDLIQDEEEVQKHSIPYWSRGA